MKKIKKVRLSSAVLVVVLLLAIGLLTAVSAGVSLKERIAQVAGQVLGNNLTQELKDSGELNAEEPSFGALSGPNVNSQCFSVNGDMTCHFTGNFADATTTIVSFVNPFRIATSSMTDVVIDQETTGFGWTRATSTIELVKLRITGPATSTFSIQCGASANPGATSTIDVLTVTEISTSTSNVTIENNMNSATYGASWLAGTVAKGFLTPMYPYFVCKIQPLGYESSFNDVTNTFDGNYTIRISE